MIHASTIPIFLEFFFFFLAPMSLETLGYLLVLSSLVLFHAQQFPLENTLTTNGDRQNRSQSLALGEGIVASVPLEASFSSGSTLMILIRQQAPRISKKNS